MRPGSRAAISPVRSLPRVVKPALCQSRLGLAPVVRADEEASVGDQSSALTHRCLPDGVAEDDAPTVDPVGAISSRVPVMRPRANQIYSTKRLVPPPTRRGTYSNTARPYCLRYPLSPRQRLTLVPLTHGSPRQLPRYRRRKPVTWEKSALRSGGLPASCSKPFSTIMKSVTRTVP